MRICVFSTVKKRDLGKEELTCGFKAKFIGMENSGLRKSQFSTR